MAEATTLPDYPRGLTFEQVWASIQELKAENDRRAEEHEKWQKEQAEKDEQRRQEAEQRSRELDRQINRVSRQMGGPHNKFGRLAEHLVAPGIVKRFNERGFHFDAITTKGMRIFDAKTHKIKAEIDIMLENGEYIIAVEVKTTPKVEDVEHHIKRLEILREFRNKWNDTRKIQGAIAGAIFGQQEKEATANAGFYVIEQSGDTMKIDVPEDFVVKEW